MSQTTTEFRQALLAIKAYPERKRRLAELRRPKLTLSYSCAGGHGSEVGDPTGAAATRTLPEKQQEELEAVERAIEQTLRLPDGTARMKVVELRFFRKTHSLIGAALEVNYSRDWAKMASGDFIREVVKELRYL